jgi:hypothetical protein
LSKKGENLTNDQSNLDMSFVKSQYVFDKMSDKKKIILYIKERATGQYWYFIRAELFKNDTRRKSQVENKG